jgi:cellulose synthase/poly-beta-1,6-N-acetylglucosamine synthase-like glycosyltransferase
MTILYFLIPLSLLSASFLFAYTLNLIILLVLAGRHGQQARLEKKQLDRYPKVTIQIPLYNELYVVERVIRGAVEIDYPIEWKEIQILDDSTDDTLRLSEQLSERYRRLGHDIKLIHRENRRGQKAGALRNGLTSAQGELILIYDADFLPSRSMLNDVVPYFQEDERLGMVQTRWGHINPEYSNLTRAQSLHIDSHFAIDQVARSGCGLFMNFNGTAGVWRKACILDAGNWQDDTLTEDLDLSYRAKLRGWRLKYVKDVVNEAELPVQLCAYKSQQFRWAKGSVQTALKLIGRVWTSSIRLFEKYQAFMHLFAYMAHPFLLLHILTAVPLLSLQISYRAYSVLLVGVLGFFGFGSFISVLFLASSQLMTYKSWRRRMTWIPLAMALGTGVAVSNTSGIIQALIGKRSEFIRTPKWGVRERTEDWRGKRYRALTSHLLVPLLELFYALYSLAGIGMALQHGRYFVIPYFAIYAVSFLYVFLLGIAQNSTLRRVMDTGS